MKKLIKDLKKVEKSNLSEDFKNKVLVKLVNSYISEKQEFSLNGVGYSSAEDCEMEHFSEMISTDFGLNVSLVSGYRPKQS